MWGLALKLLLGAALAYLAVLAFLFAFQSSFIYPAPQKAHPPGPGFAAVTLTTSDGFDLAAHWRVPDKGRPTIVWFHGNGGSLAGSADETALLAGQGYGVLLVSYRGYGANPGKPSEEGFYRDGRAAMQFLAEQSVALDETIIAGNSIGSGTATQMAREFSPAALILISPFTSLPDAAAEGMWMFPVHALLRDRYDNRSKLETIDLPVLILHGTADQVVPFAHGKALSEVAPGAEFHAFEGGGHTLSFELQAQATQFRWLAEQGL